MIANMATCFHASSYKIEKIRGLNIVYCEKCKVLFTLELFTNQIKTTGICSEKDYLEYVNDYLPHRLISYKTFLPCLEKYRQTNYLLDVGCGYGHFLTLAKSYGWNIEGVEVSDFQSEIARKNMGHIIYKDIEDKKLNKEKFDVITLWDVIEHVLDPKSMIEKIMDLLRPGGVFIIKTPDARIFTYKKHILLNPLIHFYRSYIYPSNPYEHIYHFTSENLIEVIKISGFQNIKVNFDETFNERVIPGNNFFVRFARFVFMYISWRLKWPFEFILTCEKKA